MLILVHELGHAIIAYLLKVKVKKIYLYPLGGISKFDMDLNIERRKEFLILIFGPIFQFLAYYLLCFLLPKDQYKIQIYHYGILFFNLLPIYPLDGGKLVALFIERIISYKKSLQLVILGSYGMILLLFLLNPIKLNTIIMIQVLAYLITKEKDKINYLYEKFLLERYLKEYSFSKIKKIENEKQFYRERTHQIKVNNQYISEREFLQKKYQKMPKSY